jgi:predicted membrane channel-forming protein YqfA (hemolysin III family)
MSQLIENKSLERADYIAFSRIFAGSYITICYIHIRTNDEDIGAINKKHILVRPVSVKMRRFN